MDVTPPDSRRQSESDCNSIVITDLAHQFSVHSLSSRPQCAPASCCLPHSPVSPHTLSPTSFAFSAPQNRPPTPPAEPLSPTSSLFEPSFSLAQPRRPAKAACDTREPFSRPTSSYSTASASTIRAQRQRLVRRQCSSSHLKEIRDLVARMVESGELCDIHRTQTASSDDSRPVDDCEAAMAVDDEDSDEDDNDACSLATSSSHSTYRSCTIPPASDRGGHCCIRKATRPRRRGRRRGAMSMS